MKSSEHMGSKQRGDAKALEVPREGMPLKMCTSSLRTAKENRDENSKESAKGLLARRLEDLQPRQELDPESSVGVVCEGGLENFVWLPVKGMTLLEEQELPLLATSPTSYVKLRNHILAAWHNDPLHELTLEAAAADAPVVFHTREAQAEVMRRMKEIEITIREKEEDNEEEDDDCDVDDDSNDVDNDVMVVVVVE
eukprot:758538-Hanusia_phi.AAC.5